MSNYEDDQSEDGELARSPVTQEEMDFSLSDDEMDTTDSLDIRPPQAKVISRPSKDDRNRHSSSKSDRHKEHSRRDKKHAYRERDKIDTNRIKKDTDLVRHSDRDLFHTKDHYRDREYVREKEIYREKDTFREKDHFREKEIYREKDVYREVDPYREKEVYRDKDSYRYKEPYREKDKDSAYRGKDGHRDRERDRERYIEAERNKDRKDVKVHHGTEEPPPQTVRPRDKEREKERERDKSERERGDREKTDRERTDKERDRKDDKDKVSGDQVLEDLRSRLLSKRRSKELQQDREAAGRGRDDSGHDRRSDSRRAHLERRDKLLLTEREMLRRKEEGRTALEERRLRRAKRPPSPAQQTPVPSSPLRTSPPPPGSPPTKRSRPSISPQDLITVSDVSDHEQQEEGEHSGTPSESSSDSDTDGDGEEDSGSSADEEDGSEEGETVENEGKKGSPQNSPLSVHSDTPRRSRSNTRSRSRSHSFSPPASNGVGGREGEEAEGDGETPTTPPPKSPQATLPPLPPYYPALQGCRSVEEFKCLNRIEEGTYGVVYRAKDKTTDEIVALKRLKMEKEKEGFPITSLREINTLLKGQHPNIVTVREIVVGSNMDKIFIVMDYVEHDLKGLMETMKARKQVFLPGEVKCLMQQLLRAVDHLHDNWILHRDLKTSNLLLSHKGILKVGDFGLAREYGSPLKNYTPIVVTLWYRAPELLLGTRTYSTPIDMWSVGCIFAEFVTMQALFPGKSEVDQLNRIFKDLGTPNETMWPGWSQLSGSKAQWAEQPGLGLRSRVGPGLPDSGLQLLQGLLTYDPTRRLHASTALQHNFFREQPHAIDPAMFPTWPAKSEGGRRQHSPKPPSGGDLYKQLLGGDDVTGFHMGSAQPVPAPYLPPPTSFSLKF